MIQINTPDKWKTNHKEKFDTLSRIRDKKQLVKSHQIVTVNKQFEIRRFLEVRCYESISTRPYSDTYTILFCDEINSVIASRMPYANDAVRQVLRDANIIPQGRTMSTSNLFHEICRTITKHFPTYQNAQYLSVNN